MLLQTSRNEGTPLALIQGMAAGRPLVSTAAGGVVNMVAGSLRREQDGCRWYDNGVLAEPCPAAFTSALCELADHPRHLAAMGRSASEFANASYSLPAMLESLDALYTALLDQKLSTVVDG